MQKESKDRMGTIQKMKKIGIVLLMCILSISAASAGVDDLTASVSSTYINWNWSYSGGTTECAVHVDSVFITNTTLTYYIISDLDIREAHAIVLTNVDDTTDIYATSTTKTFYSPIFFYILLLFGIAFFIISVFTKNIVIGVIIGAFGFIMSLLAFYLSFPLYFALLSYLCVGIASLCVFFVIGKLFYHISGAFTYDEGGGI